MIRRSQAFYSQFLVSALAIMFLASTQAPVQFSSTCREDFYLGLNLIEDLHPESHVSKRLWRIVWSLRQYLHDLTSKEASDAHSSAALGMIGLARGGRIGSSSVSYSYDVSGIPIGPTGPMDPSVVENIGQNGQLLSDNFTQMFEQYVGHNGFNSIRPNADGMQTQEQARFMAQSGLFTHMRQMF